MTPQELFNTLVEKKQITVPYTGELAESLRVQLVKKFSWHKNYMDKVGFLDNVTAQQVVSMERGENSTTYHLRKKKAGFNYQLIDGPGDTDAEVRTDMAECAESTIRNMGDSENPPASTATADPSSEKREDAGSSTSAQSGLANGGQTPNES